MDLQKTYGLSWAMVKQVTVLLLVLCSIGTVVGQSGPSVSISAEKTLSQRSIVHESLSDTEVKSCFLDPNKLLEVWPETPPPLSGYSKEMVEHQKKLNTLNAERFILSYSKPEDEHGYQTDKSLLASPAAALDYEEITPFTWKWVDIVIENEDGSQTEISLRRPNWWFKHNNVTRKGESIYISLPEMMIAGTGTVTNIRPSLIDTRLHDFEWDETGHTRRPITGKFKRSPAEIWDFTFTNGDVIGATPNHPFFSARDNFYKPIGQFEIGESVILSNGLKERLRHKQKRPGEEPVTNLEVWRDHNYFVGDSGYLAHNLCRVAVAISDPRNQRLVEDIISSWNPAQRERFLENLTDSPLAARINAAEDRANSTLLFTRSQITMHEVMDWSRNTLFVDNIAGFKQFAESNARVQYYQEWRFVTFIGNKNSLINVSLGIRESSAGYHSSVLKSSFFTDFFNNGFISNPNLPAIANIDIWLPLVARTIQKSTQKGGKIYFHADGIDDFAALYDNANEFFGSGTMTELMYLIDSGLYDIPGKVEFRLGPDVLSGQRLTELNDAVQIYKQSEFFGTHRDAHLR